MTFEGWLNGYAVEWCWCGAKSLDGIWVTEHFHDDPLLAAAEAEDDAIAGLQAIIEDLSNSNTDVDS